MDFKALKKIQEKIMKGDLMDRISVIIRNRNEEQYIGFAIQSVLDHFNKPEIIIVDNNSTDNSIEVVSMFRPTLKQQLKIVTIDDYSPGAALNEGVKHCTYESWFFIQVLVLFRYLAYRFLDHIVMMSIMEDLVQKVTS